MKLAKLTNNYFNELIDRSFSFFDDNFGEELNSVFSTVGTHRSVEKSDKYIVSIEAPGFKDGEIKVNVTNNRITVDGKRELKDDEKSLYSSSSFYETWVLPNNIEQNSITAKLENGVLLLEVPKKSVEKSETKEIPVTVK